MSILKVEQAELYFFLDKISRVVSFDKDLPMNVFVGDKLLFWFFERPLFCFYDIFAGLISESISSFNSKVFIKFSGDEPLADSCFSIDGSDVGRDVSWLNSKFDSFFDGKVGYPIVVCNDACDWVAFESAHEEFGVVAVKSSVFHEGFCSYLNSNFISMNELAKLAVGSSSESVIAGKLISSYSSSFLQKNR